MKAATTAPDSSALAGYDYELEAGILAALLYDATAMAEFGAVLSPQHFSDPLHQAIAEAIWQLFEKGIAIDILLTKQQAATSLADEQLTFYLEQLYSRMSSNPVRDAYQLIENAIRRDVAALAMQVLERAHAERADAGEVVAFYEERLLNIAGRYLHHDAGLLSDLMPRAVAAIQNKEQLLPTGYALLDTVLGGGISKSDLIIIAARPSTGKTAFAMALARNMATSFPRVGVAVFSLEMPAMQLTNRLLAAETGIALEHFRSASLAPADWGRLTNVRHLANAPIYVDDEPALSVYQIRSRLRRMKSELNIGLVIIDYLQLISGGMPGQTREQAVAQTSRMLKVVAKELNIPIIALSQLSRAVETRGGDKRPQLSDLRESGAIEQDADMVWFLYRPELYGIDFDEEDNPTRNMVEVIVAKNRSGATGKAKLQFTPTNMRFA